MTGVQTCALPIYLSGSKNQYTYRWTMSNEDGEYLCYTIESVPLLSEKIPLPEGGEI